MINEVDLKSLWNELDAYSKDLDKEESTLKEVWLSIAQINAKNESEIKDMNSKPEFTFLNPETPIGLNIGGQIFETTVEILTSKDPYSILAAICRTVPVIKPNEHGLFFFDRDWWLFRHIIAFLRSNTLPNELETLKELYVEASYYRLESLQKAIESIPISNISNLTPQIAVTWPNTTNNNNNTSQSHSNPLQRQMDTYVLDRTLFKNM